MNWIFLGIILIAFFVAAWGEIGHVPIEGMPTPMEALTTGMLESANGAVELALGLIGTMTLFLGLLKVAEAGGLLVVIARVIRPLMTRLFPEVPPDHPAMGAMILNMSAGALGLGNAATPFGIRAMQELDKLNIRPGTATNSMVLFLAINTSSITLLPTTVIAIRAAAGSVDPAAILPSTLFASVCATTFAILITFFLQRFFPIGPPDPDAAPMSRPWIEDDATRTALLPDSGGYPAWASMLALGAILALIPITILWGRTISPWIIPSLMAGFLVFGAARGVRIYEMFIEGAKEGFQVALRIIPYLVAILVAVGMFRASGAMDVMVNMLGGFTSQFGLPAEALPMALLRPLSGSGAYGVMVAIINDPVTGPDTYVGYLVTTLQGSSETTFYVLAVYYGAIQIRRMRHTLAAALAADVVAVIASVAICSYLFL